MASIKPISFRYQGAFLPKHGISQEEIDQFSTQLEATREEVLRTDLQLVASVAAGPMDNQPLDVGFREMPERMLDEYQSNRASSELGRILETAVRLRERVDKVVVVGIGGSGLGARALMEACCQPYFNELTRAERGGRPRMYFAGDNLDNDWSRGLLGLLKNSTTGDGPEGKWGIVVISNGGGTLETTTPFRPFLAELENLVGRECLPDYVVPVIGNDETLNQLADAIGCRDRFSVPAGVDGRFSVLSAMGLLPAAILGIDIVTLLEGAAQMNSRFRTQPAGRNPVLDYVAVNHLLKTRQGRVTRELSVWNKSMESVGAWYEQLLAGSLATSERTAFPLTSVNSRNLHARGLRHRKGAPAKVINNVIVDTWRCDPLPIGTSPWEQDPLNELSEMTLPEIMSAAIAAADVACKEDNCPTTSLHFPAADEGSLGQFFQMMMLATVVEGRLIGIDPCCQPGVERDNKYLNPFLYRPVTM